MKDTAVNFKWFCFVGIAVSAVLSGFFLKMLSGIVFQERWGEDLVTPLGICGLSCVVLFNLFLIFHLTCFIYAYFKVRRYCPEPNDGYTKAVGI